MSNKLLLARAFRDWKRSNLPGNYAANSHTKKREPKPFGLYSRFVCQAPA